LTVDEFEAIRLADLEGLYQEQAAREMNVSRQTFGRIIESAHRKVAEALVKGKALKIEGGDFEMAAMRKFRCYDCQHTWELPHGTGRPGSCPACKSGNIHRAEEDRGYARGYRVGQGRRCGRNPQRQQQ
jgi:predicted Zn-ribbon and HTH transcriptional regulator